MSGPFRIYPRLAGVAAEQLVSELARTAVVHQWADRHEDQTFTSIGSPVEPAALVGVRQAVEAALVSAGLSAVVRGNAAEWDRTVGWALHRATSMPSTRMSPMEAASTDVWSWMTLVLMPDIALRRFSDGSSSRMHGGPRNVFRKVWWRVEVLGELADPTLPETLGEDELVGIFERTSLGRNRSVARAIFRRIVAFDDRGRTEYSRALSRTVLRDLAHVSTALLDEDAADALVTAAHHRIGVRDGAWVYTG
jgi:hypothetical protein